MARAAYGVPKQVLALSIASIPTRSHKNFPISGREAGIDQMQMLRRAMIKMPKNIKPSRLPKNLLFVLSERCPISGSLTPSQREEIATAMPTSEPEIPITEVPKNIIKLFNVCDIEL